MNSSFYAGVAGLLSYQENLNVVGNNITNVGTAGFQPLRTAFEDLLYTKLDVKSADVQSGHGVKAAGRDLLLRQGNPNQTNRALDFAIMGDGFFAVEREGEIQYTRNGSFSISVEDDAGFLVASDGGYVLDGRGRRIELPHVPGEGAQGYDTKDVKNQLGVYFFPNPYGLEPCARSRFLATDTSGEAVSAEEGEYADRYQILENTLEQSAVDLSEEMVGMITAQRGYQFSAKVVQTSDEIEEVLNNLR